jgi:ribosomal protein L29
MKHTKYNDKTAKDLEKTLVEKRRSLRSYYFGFASSRGTNVKEARTLRQEIARILTALAGQQK